MRVPEGRVPVHMDYALRLTGRPEPRICVLNTEHGRLPSHASRRCSGRPLGVITMNAKPSLLVTTGR